MYLVSFIYFQNCERVLNLIKEFIKKMFNETVYLNGY